MIQTDGYVQRNTAILRRGHLRSFGSRGLGFPVHLKDASCRLSRDSKISETLEPFVKARGSKISEIFGAGGATKILGDFWSRGPCLRPPERFFVYLSLAMCTAARRSA